MEAEEILRKAYRAFDARDVEAAVALMDEDVDWPNAWEGGRVARSFATRSAGQTSPKVGCATGTGSSKA
jgi:ketosteroid isomerase-like protein